MAGLLSDLRDFGQGASNAAASTVSGPLDLLAMLMRKAGIPVPSNAVGGSEWMAQRGLTAQPKNQTAGLLGEAAGLISPIVAQAKAPQIARGLLQVGENAAKPRTLSNQQGAIVWHGSPHKFDKFDSSKIGTGEGAQAYGHGLYLAESKDVADEYAGKLSEAIVDFANKSPTTFAEKRLAKIVSNAAERAQYAARGKFADDAYRAVADPMRDTLYGNSFVGIKPLPPKELAKALVMQRAAKRLGPPSVGDSGSLYKVDLPDPVIARMLDWDKPLSQQAPEVQKAVFADIDEAIANTKKALATASERRAPTTASELEKLQRERVRLSSLSGGDYYRQKSLGVTAGQPMSADELRSLGIPGIRYLDGGSRGTGQGTSNFVVFPGEESILRILERNGVSF